MSMEEQLHHLLPDDQNEQGGQQITGFSIVALVEETVILAAILWLLNRWCDAQMTCGSIHISAASDIVTNSLRSRTPGQIG